MAGHDAMKANMAEEQTFRAMDQPSTAPSIGEADTVFKERIPAEPQFGVGKTIAGYELVKELGRGGMGVVYMAYEPQLKRMVALKLMNVGGAFNPTALLRFRAEAEVVARLQHPNIVGIYEIGEHDGTPFLALEYLSSGSLDDYLDGTPWPNKPAARMVRLLAEAMHHAHQRGVVHRDLKPANVLLNFNREAKTGLHDALPKITDFGLAKRLDDAAGPSQSGDLLGTPSYMAPEQAAGKVHEIGPATDTYALGAILFELTTGRPPHWAGAAMDTVLNVINEDPVAPRLLNPKLDRDLETICLRALHKTPQKRYATAQDLAADLDRYDKGEPILARPMGLVDKSIRWCRRNPARSAALALSIISILTLLLFGAGFHRRLAAQLTQTELAHRKLQDTLTAQAAERLDGDLRQIARVPDLIATSLAVLDDWSEAELTAILRDVLGKEPRIFGMSVAFEPFAFDKNRENFALYVCRGENGFITKQLLPPDYTPIYREWAWYSRSRTAGKNLWSELYFDEGGGNVPMLTYSVPLTRQGKFAGVVTADLSADYFQVLNRWLREWKVHSQGHAFVTSPAGAFIVRPDSELTLAKNVSEWADHSADPTVKQVARRMLAGESGRVDGEVSNYFFSPIPSARWSLCVVVPAGR